MTLKLPIGWEVQPEDEVFIRAARPDGAAWLEAAVDSTGYELPEEYFCKYVEASLAFLYGNALDYEQQETPVEGATAETITSPDGEAAVQVILLDAEPLPAETDIRQITIKMLKDLEVDDLHRVGDAILNDGRLHR
jgi:hypothetical protein